MSAQPPLFNPNEDPPPAQWLQTFHALASGMSSGFITWCGHRHGPVTDEQVDTMMFRIVFAAIRTTDQIWGTSYAPAAAAADEAAWPAL